MYTYHLLGVAGPTGDSYAARWLEWVNDPAEVIDALRRILADTCGGDVTHLTGTLLAHDWDTLDADTGPDVESIAGFGGTIFSQSPEPYAGRLSEGFDHDRYGRDGEDVAVGLLFLIHPNGTVDVYDGTVRGRWAPHSSHNLHADAGTSRVGLLQAVEPHLRWADPEGFAAAAPDLAPYPLHLVHLALAAMHPGRDTVIAGPGGAVWLLASTHVLLVQPVSVDTGAGTVLLPRPLGGSWDRDHPAVLATAGQVADVCVELTEGVADALDLREARHGMYAAGANAAAALTAGWRPGEPVPDYPLDPQWSSNPILADLYAEYGDDLLGPWVEFGASWRDQLLDAHIAGFNDTCAQAIADALATRDTL